MTNFRFRPVSYAQALTDWTKRQQRYDPGFRALYAALTPQQRHDLYAHGYFLVEAYGVYRLSASKRTKPVQLTQRKPHLIEHRFCINFANYWTKWSPTHADRLLTHKLMLESDEAHWLRTANRLY